MDIGKASGSEWSIQESRDRLNRAEDFFVLDVRNRDEFDAWRLEGRAVPPTLNVPYFEMLEEGGEDDFVDSVVAYAGKALLPRLPSDLPILAVCAKGDTSAFVAEGLRRMGFEAFNLRGGMQAWGEHYEVRSVVSEPDLSVQQVSRPARGCLSYVVASGDEAVVVDPLRHVDRYIDLCGQEELGITAVIDTHAHADHLSGGLELASRAGSPYFLHPYDAVHPIDLVPARIRFRHLADGDRIAVGTTALEVLHIPGHTLGNIALLLAGRYLLAGDSIFIDSISRPDLGGRAEAWSRLHYESLGRLLELPDDVLVLPGHFSRAGEAGDDGAFRASLGSLRQRNEGLRMAAEPAETFSAYIQASLPDFPERYVDIKRVNAGLLEVDEDRAIELELGKNLCAMAAAAAREDARSEGRLA